MKTENTMAAEVVKRLTSEGKTLSSAESCTGGLIAKCITDIPGSSAVFFGACVTYTNEVKMALLGVEPAIIAEHTEVSRECAAAMAQGVRQRLGTDIGVATTGYAGPGGGTAADPVGTVYLAVSTRQGCYTERFSAPAGADRITVREAAACRILELLLAAEG